MWECSEDEIITDKTKNIHYGHQMPEKWDKIIIMGFSRKSSLNLLDTVSLSEFKPMASL